MSKVKHAFGSSNTDLSDSVLKLPITSGSKCSHFREKTMGYKWVKLSKFSCFEYFELNIPSDRVFPGLSENHKIIQIGPPETKLWPIEHNHYNKAYNF